MRTTVPTPIWCSLAVFIMPMPLASVALTAVSTSAAIRGRPSVFSLALGPRQASADTFLDDGALEFSEHA
jgi:hypothetical protein